MNAGTELTETAARAALRGLTPDSRSTDAVADYARAIWSFLAEPGDGIAGCLRLALGPEAALRVVLNGEAVPASAGVTREESDRARARWKPRLDQRAIAAGLATARAAGIRLLTPGHEEWPGRLDDLGIHGPACLWVRGDPAAASAAVSVAIVGARAATSYGELVAGELAAELAGAGILVVSGAAYGIDGAAHRAALGAGGTTVALSAGGVERPYPSGHAQLSDRIARSGAVMSEVPCGGAPTKWRFLQRNRLIAALSDVTVVVEAGWRSGSLNTAGHAAALGRLLGAVPGPVTSAASAGTHRLLREYDAVCVTGAADVREMLGVDRPTLSLTGDGRTDDVTRVRDALSSRSHRSIDEIAARCGMPLDEVTAVLGLLQLEGTAEHGSAGWRRPNGARAR
jgi:DNA processing protein